MFAELTRLLSISSARKNERFCCFADEQVKPLPANTELIQRKKSRQMDRLRRTLSFRSRKKHEHRAQANTATAAAASPTTTTLPPTTTTTTAPKNGTATTPDSKPVQWQDDEKSVRVGACSFTVKVIPTTRKNGAQRCFLPSILAVSKSKNRVACTYVNKPSKHF